MKSNLSLGKFRNEIGTYSRFMLEYDDPLTPLAFSTQFSHASVILSASPYIALKNGVDFLCLTHIQAIKKKGKMDGYQVYIFVCGEYAMDGEPIPVRFTLKCA